jgi:chromosome partitioning protein
MGFEARIGNPARPSTGLAGKGWDVGGEHPSVVVGDVASRPRQRAHVLVFANEKGGVGKSTLAFHAAIALADAGRKVAAIDLDATQATLSRALTNREATCRLLKTGLPTPRHVTLAQPSGAYLWQEMARICSDSDVIVIDVAGSDTPIGRRAIALADTLVTPVNCSFADLDLLGQFDGHRHRLQRLGHFARLVNALREAREARRLPPLDWLVLPNRQRHTGSVNDALALRKLEHLAARAGFRLGEGFVERVAYRELFLLGLTHLDLRRIPGLARVKPLARREIDRFVHDLAVPLDDRSQPSLFPLNDNADALAIG